MPQRLFPYRHLLQRRRLAAAGLTFLIGFTGAVGGLAVGGTHTAAVGPFTARLDLAPAWYGRTVVDIPPFGASTMRTHTAPVLFTATITRLRPEAARAIARNPGLLDKIANDTERDLRHAALILAIRAASAAILGAALLAAVTFRSVRRATLAAATAVATLATAATWTWLSYQPRALDEPRYTGLLAAAPGIVGDLTDIAGRYGKYRAQIGRLVTTVSGVYTAASHLPAAPDTNTIRVLHISDLHLSPEGFDIAQEIAKNFHVDLVIDSGDLTDHGTTPEGRFASRIRQFGVPYAWVKGNHDSPAISQAVAAQPNATVLTGQLVTLAGVPLIGGPDPLFTPAETPSMYPFREQALASAGKDLADTIDAYPRANRPWLAVVHSPQEATELIGHVSLILAGHTHQRNVTRDGNTITIVQGSTGGAGLRAVENTTPTPIEMSVLYLDRLTGVLRAYDDVTVGGLGLAAISVDRHLAESIPATKNPRALPDPLQPEPGTSLKPIPIAAQEP